MNHHVSPSLKNRLAVFSAAALVAAAAHAGGPSQITKDNNTDNMDLSTSWVGGVVPGPSNIAVFDSTINPITTSIQFGVDTSWAGIKMLGPVQGGAAGSNGLVLGNTTGNASTINASNLTLGSAGIDLSAATTPLAIGASIIIAANQTWNVTTANQGITTPAPNAPPFPANSLLNGSSVNPFGLNAPIGLLFSGVGAMSGPANQIPFDLGGFTVNTTGNGTIMLHSGFNMTNGTINVGNGAGAPVFYNGFSNFGETFIMQSGGTHNASVAADVTFNVATSLRFQSNSGSMISNAVINLGKDSSNTTVNGAILGLVTANTGAGNQTNLTGPLNVFGNSTLTVSNQPQTGTGGASNAATTISGNISGSGNLTVQVSANAANNILHLSGDNSGFTGALNLTTGNPDNPGSRTIRFLTSTAGSSNAAWQVDTGNTFQIGTTVPSPTPATINLGTLTGAGNITGLAAGSAINVGAGNFTGVLGANLSLTKVAAGSGPNVLLLGGDSPAYNGTTTISDGFIILTGNIANSTVVVESLGGLGGNGTAGAVTTLPGGRLAPDGDLSVASLLWDGATDGAATIGIELSNTSDTSDHLTVAGNLLKGSTGTTFLFDFSNTGNALGGPTVYNLITFGGITDFTAGDFSYTGLAAGLTGSFGVTAQNIILSVSPVPEPAEWAALLGACALLAALRRRRARA